jgi:hypothetical protein
MSFHLGLGRPIGCKFPGSVLTGASMTRPNGLDVGTASTKTGWLRMLDETNISQTESRSQVPMRKRACTAEEMHVTLTGPEVKR